MKEYNACYDIPDERDYKYKKVFEDEILLGSELPKSFLLDNVEYQNQGLERITRMMCVFYSTAHVSNEENYQEGSDIRINAKKFGLLAEDLGRLDVDKGALVSAGPKTARDEGYISGWTLIETVEEAKNSIYQKRPIVVGSNKIKWSKGYKTPFVLGGDEGNGHAVAIIGYDDDYEGGCFIIKQSYGKDKYDEGKQYLKYEDFGLLFKSKYSLIDTPDPILEYKKQVMEEINIEKAKEAFDNGFWNGTNPTQPASREEVATMIQRVYEKLLK